MITLSTNINALLANNQIEMFYLLDINGTRSTTYFRDITVSGSLYTANNKIISIDPPQISSSVDREAYKVMLSDNDFAMAGDVYGTSLINRPIELRAGFISGGVPYTTLTDTFLLYKGVIDSGDYKVQTSEIGDVLLVLSCASPMANLDLVRSFETSKDFARKRDPTDSSFDQVYTGGSMLSLKWGKL